MAYRALGLGWGRALAARVAFDSLESSVASHSRFTSPLLGAPLVRRFGGFYPNDPWHQTPGTSGEPRGESARRSEPAPDRTERELRGLLEDLMGARQSRPASLGMDEAADALTR